MPAADVPRLRRRHVALAIIAAATIVGVSLALYSPVARRFGLMGTEHILSGFDHLVFLLMLMIVAREIKDLIFVATAFTVAHSITISAATLDWVQFSPAWIEPLIVATILYVAVENFLAATPKSRLLFTFGFGLVHGLGFASALAEGPLPKTEELLALFSFNIGVEIGQIFFLAACFPLWQRLLRHAPEIHARRALSGVAILLCVFWLWQRLV
jgi:hypothetical protein